MRQLRWWVDNEYVAPFRRENGFCWWTKTEIDRIELIKAFKAKGIQVARATQIADRFQDRIAAGAIRYVLVRGGTSQGISDDIELGEIMAKERQAIVVRVG